MKRISLMLIIIILAFITLLVLSSKSIKADEYTHIYPNKNPYLIQISPDGSNLIAATTNGIAIIDKTTMVITQEYHVPYTYFGGIVLDPAGEYLYFTFEMGTNATGHVGRIRLSDGQIESIDLSPSNMAELTMDESGDYVYICGGTWPPIGEGVSQEHFNNYIGTGRIFEVRTSDFTLNRTLALGIDNTGISYQNGKLVVMSCEMQRFESPATGKLMCGNTCIVVDVEDFQIEHELAVGLGDMNMSFAIPDSDYVMLGYNVDRADGVGFALINVLTGDLEQAYVTDPNYNNENRNPEGGGLEMAFDLENNKLYATLYIAREAGQTQYRVGVIDMTTNEYVDWLVEPFRYYRDILFDPISGNLYLTAPLDDAIVVLEPPQ